MPALGSNAFCPCLTFVPSVMCMRARARQSTTPSRSSRRAHSDGPGPPSSGRRTPPSRGTPRPRQQHKPSNDPPVPVFDKAFFEKHADLLAGDELTEQSGVRINKCFKSFASRRESETFIEQQRVTVNGTLARLGDRVHPGDVVRLDDDEIDWERLTVAADTPDFVYIKHWKAYGVICTTDASIPENIVARIPQFNDNSDRIFPIGRLDQTASGVILLTSDGRLPGAALGAQSHVEKHYIVTADMPVSDAHLDELRRGVTISTVAQRDRNVRKKLTSTTLPCEVERMDGHDGMQLSMKLREGRNRQIRKMLGVLGYTTREIHRVGFMGITLDGLSGPGDSCQLNEAEMAIVEETLRNGSE